MKATYSKAMLAGVLLASTIGISAGFWKMWQYEATPGRTEGPAVRWPSNCPLERVPGSPTLIIAVHPNCPCSRATIGELAKLQARFPGQLRVDVLFVRPRGFTQDWATTDLWRDAARIPGVLVVSDETQLATSLFGARVSGEVFLYDGAGTLRFHGGITASRGHAGDNDGRAAIEEFLNSGVIPIDHTPVFGCALQSSDSEST
jgi:hypothetical protein